MTASLKDLIAAYDIIRDKCRTDPKWDNDAGHAKWIDAYYAVVECPCLTPADAITKCQFVAKAMDTKDMGFFEEEKVIRSIAALGGGVHPDAELIEHGRKGGAA